MFRYVRAAFWAGPRIPGLGRVPWNALAVAGACMFGFVEHSVWLAGLGVETLYLYALATNGRFQNVVDANDLARIRSSDTVSREQMLRSLPPVARDRQRDLDKKVRDIDELYREADAESLVYDSNREALQKLSDTYLRLLVAQRNLLTLGNTDEQQICTQIAGLEQSLQTAGGSEPLRESRKATLALLRQRLRNLDRREESLAEIESDLTRIETQIALAKEDASLKGKPSVVTANLDFVSHLFMDEEPVDVTTTTTSNVARSSEIEN
jgi:hypothetical protein